MIVAKSQRHSRQKHVKATLCIVVWSELAVKHSVLSQTISKYTVQNILVSLKNSESTQFKVGQTLASQDDIVMCTVCNMLRFINVYLHTMSTHTHTQIFLSSMWSPTNVHDHHNVHTYALIKTTNIHNTDANVHVQQSAKVVTLLYKCQQSTLCWVVWYSSSYGYLVFEFQQQCRCTL